MTHPVLIKSQQFSQKLCLLARLTQTFCLKIEEKKEHSVLLVWGMSTTAFAFYITWLGAKGKKLIKGHLKRTKKCNVISILIAKENKYKGDIQPQTIF